MLFSAILLSLSIIGTASALPSPSASSSLATLATRGIDPSGPMPADAVLLPSGGFSFAADSDTAHWIRAQDTLSKRELSGLSVTLWTQSGCRGAGVTFGNVNYSVQSVGSQEYFSIEYRGRALLGNEQLDLSVDQGGADKCAKFVRTLPGGNAPGCYSQPAFSCIRLLKF